MKDNEVVIYRLLGEVFSKEAYSSIALNETLKAIEDSSARAYITKIFYGVIEKSVQFDFIIAELSEKKPKNSVAILIKIGLYLLRYTDTPSYAAINKTVSLARQVGKTGVAGFINALLRKSVNVELASIQFKSVEKRLSVLYSCPIWICKKLIDQYGESEAEAFLSYQKKEKTHIRNNLSKISAKDFEDKLREIVGAEKSELGFYVSHDIMRRIPSDLFTAQSYSSMLATHAYMSKSEYDDAPKQKVLDVCAAPGGKSIYLKQLFPRLEIVACDVHSHRLKLMREYAERMGVSLSLVLNDGTKLKKEWENQFDLVICDVPCSGLGLVNSKPDIILNRSELDIENLTAIQNKILEISAKYVKKGGVLCYSTCTVLREENADIVDNFLVKNKDFEIMPIDNGILKADKYMQLLPHKNDCDGFFIAKLKRRNKQM